MPTGLQSWSRMLPIVRYSVARALSGVLILLMCSPRADASTGSLVFKKACEICHSLVDGRTTSGPSLGGIVGRRAASLPNFNYSSGLKALDVTWTRENLDRWLQNPMEMVPGTMMSFPGLKSVEERKALIEYLAKPDSD